MKEPPNQLTLFAPPGSLEKPLPEEVIVDAHRLFAQLILTIAEKQKATLDNKRRADE